MPLYCNENAALEACAKAKGWPAGPTVREGSDAPGGVEVGYWRGDLYVRTTPAGFYVFLGTPGETDGWYEVTVAPS